MTEKQRERRALLGQNHLDGSLNPRSMADMTDLKEELELDDQS